jgi:hypothetical protein
MTRPTHLNQWQRTIRAAARLLPADVSRQINIVNTAIDTLLRQRCVSRKDEGVGA